MSRIFRRVALPALFVAVALGGCKKKSNDSAGTAPATSDAMGATTPTPTPPPTTPPTTGASDGGAAMAGGDGGAGMAMGKPTDAQILAIVTAANQADIDGGKLAQQKATSADVKAFGADMVKDHTQMQADGDAAAKKASLTPEENEASKQMTADAKANADKLAGLDGDAFDKAYVEGEVTMHQEVLDTLDNVLIPAAQNADLKTALQGARAKVAEHLEHAKTLQGKLK